MPAKDREGEAVGKLQCRSDTRGRRGETGGWEERASDCGSTLRKSPPAPRELCCKDCSQNILEWAEMASSVIPDQTVTFFTVPKLIQRKFRL